MRSSFASLTLAFLCLGLASCVSPGFEKQWRAAAAKPAVADSVEGAWQGTWLSHGNGHHGKLRCVVGPALDKNGTRELHYRATWAHVFSGGFTARAAVKSGAGGSTFSMKQNLGRYGDFESQAKVVGDQFTATYKAVGDHGVFQMQRAGH